MYKTAVINYLRLLCSLNQIFVFTMYASDKIKISFLNLEDKFYSIKELIKKELNLIDIVIKNVYCNIFSK